MQTRHFFVAKTGTYLEASNLTEFWPLVEAGAPSDWVLEIRMENEHHYISGVKHKKELSTDVESGALKVLSHDAGDEPRVLIQYGAWAFAQYAPLSEFKVQ